MAFKHGSRAILHITDVNGVYQNFSQYIGNTTFTGPIDAADVTTLGAYAKRYIDGLRDHSFPLDGPWTPEVDDWLFAIMSSSAYSEFRYAPGGSVTGYPSYSGSVLLTSYEVTAAVSDAAKFTATMQVSGCTTKTTL